MRQGIFYTEVAGAVTLFACFILFTILAPFAFVWMVYDSWRHKR